MIVIYYCEQQFMELQELYNSQQLVNANLTGKLERTEVCCYASSFVLNSYLMHQIFISRHEIIIYLLHL